MFCFLYLDSWLILTFYVKRQRVSEGFVFVSQNVVLVNGMAAKKTPLV